MAVLTLDEARKAAQAAGIKNANRLDANDLAKKLDIAVEKTNGKIVEAPSVKKAEALAQRQLKAAGQSEIKAMKAEGATREEIRAEQQANRQELADAKTFIAPTGFQQIPQMNDAGYILSNVSTYANRPYAQTIQNNFNAAIGLLDEYNIPQLDVRSSGDSKIRTGVSLTNAYAIADAKAKNQPITADLLKENYGGYVGGAGRVAKIFNGIDEFRNNPSITAEDFSKRLKPVKGQENVFTTKLPGGTTGVFNYNPETQTYSYNSATPVQVKTDSGGFFSSPLGKLVVGLAGGFLLGPTSVFLQQLGMGSTLATTLAGVGIGAGTSAITGGDLLTGAVLGGFGGFGADYIGQAGGLGNVVRDAGVTLGDDTVNLLNRIVSGVRPVTPGEATLANRILNNLGIGNSNATQPGLLGATDEAVTSAIGAADDIGPGTLLDDAIAAGPRGGVLNQVNPFVQTNVPGAGFTAGSLATPGGYGLTSAAPGVSEALQDLFQGVTWSDPNQVTRAAMDAARIAGQNISLTLPGGNFVVTSTPAGVTTQTPFNTFGQTGPVFGQQPPAPPADTGIDKGILSGIGLPEIAAGVGIVSGLVGGGPSTTTGGAGKPPTLAPDIDLSIPGLQNIGGAGNFPGGMGGFDFNAFMDLYRRGGLGAGQYLGYDLARMLGDIPAQTLLGTPTLGGQIGQASMGQASLV